VENSAEAIETTAIATSNARANLTRVSGGNLLRQYCHAHHPGTGMSDLNKSSSGFDRRSALKKAAAAGTIAWVAPAITSSKVSAVELIGACTAKCQPNNQATVSFTVTIADCISGTPPGRQAVRGTITQTGADGDPCPCSAGIVQIISPTPGQIQQLAPNPGNWDGVIEDVTVLITCRDRSENIITTTCTFSVQVGGGSGNCNSRGGDVYTVNNIPVGTCGTPTCP
jgi:hypothetical protein